MTHPAVHTAEEFVNHVNFFVSSDAIPFIVHLHRDHRLAPEDIADLMLLGSLQWHRHLHRVRLAIEEGVSPT